MDHLPKKDIKLLKTISRKSPMAYSELTENQSDACKHLKKMGLIEISNRVMRKEINRTVVISEQPSSISITKAGEIYLSNWKTDRIRFLVPTAISIVAVIVSLLSIILSPIFNEFFSQFYGF